MSAPDPISTEEAQLADKLLAVVAQSGMDAPSGLEAICLAALTHIIHEFEEPVPILQAAMLGARLKANQLRPLMRLQEKPQC